MTDTEKQPAMSAAELNSLATQCYGQRWQSAFARDFGQGDLNIRTVQRWAVSGIIREATANNVRQFLTERRVATIPAPDPALTEDERDDACHDALEPSVIALASAADDNGWHPAEVWIALFSISVEQIMMMAGKDEAIKTLNDAIDMIEAQ